MHKKILLVFLSWFFIFQQGAAATLDDEIFLQIKQNHQLNREAKRELLRQSIGVFGNENSSQENFDVQRYQLNLEVIPASRSIIGSVVMTAKSTIDGLHQVELDLYDNLAVTAVTGNGTSFTHQSNVLQIELDKIYNQEQPFEVTIQYQGQPRLTQSLGMGFGSHGGQPAIYTVSCPYYARTWWPCKDVPWDKADAVDINIKVPQNLIAASNGSLQQVIDNQDGTMIYCWHEGYPITTYLIMLSIADYAVLQDWYLTQHQDSMKIIHYVFRDHTNAATEDFENIPGMIEYFASVYGEYPYITEKYGVAEYEGVFAGMEHQTLISYLTSYITGNHAHESTVAHELAHQWWGDCVSISNWHDTWLSEGFATYSEALYFGHLHGMETYHNYMNTTLNALSFTEPIYRYDTSQPFALYDDVVYDKGAWVVHTLRHVVGDSNFFKILTDYRQAFDYGNAATEDFQHVCEQVYGADLSWFFQEWIYEAGCPHYQVRWTTWPAADSWVVEGIVDQVQTNAPLFKMPVDVTIATEHGDTTMVVWIAEQQTYFRFTVNSQAENLTLDKDNWLIRYVLQCEQQDKVLMRGFTIDDRSGGNDNGSAEATETIALALHLYNQFGEMKKVNGLLSTSNPNVEVVTAHAVFGDIGENRSANNLADPFIVKIKPDVPAGWVSFELLLTDEFNFKTTLPCRIFVGSAQVLLVDDDGGDQYEHYYLSVLDSLGIMVDHWDVQYRGLLKSTRLADYQDNSKLIIWYTGNSDSATLTDEDQTALTSFLDNGGNLFLTGQDIGQDLVENGQGAAFFEQYLHAQLVQENFAGPKGLSGVPGDAISDGMMVVLTGAGSANNQDSPSVIAAVSGAVPIFNYLGTNHQAALRYEGNYKLVYFAFGFEAIIQTNPRTVSPLLVLTRILDWMGIETSVDDQGGFTQSLPEQFELMQNYPNPFYQGQQHFFAGNAATKIDYALNLSGYVTLDVYNICGQHVRTLVQKQLSPGNYEASWDGNDRFGKAVSSGIYFYALRIKPHAVGQSAKDMLRTRKLLLINNIAH